MSPTVRDGRRQRTEYAVELAAIGTGPIERRQAGAHERAGFAPGRPSPGLPAAVPRRVRIAEHETPVAALIHLADPPVTTVTPEEPFMASDPPPVIPVESQSHLEQDPPVDNIAVALAALKDASLAAVDAYSDHLVAKRRWEQARGSLMACYRDTGLLAVQGGYPVELRVDAAESTRPHGSNIPEIISEWVRGRVAVDEPALEQERQAALEDIAVAAALRDDRLGDEPADDAPEIVTRPPQATSEPAGEPGRTAAETRRAAAAAGGGPGGRPPFVARMLEALVANDGDFTLAANDAGIKRTSLVGSMAMLRKRTDLTDAERAAVARKRG